jgi:hypothetical protein
MMENEIRAKLTKSCPCCGGKNILMDNPEWLQYHTLHSVSIKCGDCGLEITGYDHKWENGRLVDTTLADAYRDALKRWNRRAA